LNTGLLVFRQDLMIISFRLIVEAPISIYFDDALIGGTPKEEVEAAAAGGAPVPSHHNPLFGLQQQRL
jgi:hypothetical protein